MLILSAVFFGMLYTFAAYGMYNSVIGNDRHINNNQPKMLMFKNYEQKNNV